MKKNCVAAQHSRSLATAAAAAAAAAARERRRRRALPWSHESKGAFRMFFTVKIHLHALEKPFKSKKCLLDRISSSIHSGYSRWAPRVVAASACVCVVGGGRGEFSASVSGLGGGRGGGGIGRGLPSFLSPHNKRLLQWLAGSPPPSNTTSCRRARSLSLSLSLLRLSVSFHPDDR